MTATACVSATPRLFLNRRWSSAETNKVVAPANRLCQMEPLYGKAARPMTLVRGDGSEFGLNRSIRIGRSKDNDIDLLEDTSAHTFIARLT